MRIRKSLTFHCAPQPSCKFNVDANSGHAFGILLASVGVLRPCGAPAPVNTSSLDGANLNTISPHSHTYP